MTARRKLRHGKPAAGRGEQKRVRIASEAARIMAEEGVRDYQMAKRKAIARLNLAEPRDLPTNEEIEAALSDHLQLFHAPKVAGNARRLRELAAEAMRFLADYQPKLVGSVLSGTVTATSEIQLHVTADSPEDLGWFLQEHGIPFELGERRVRFGGDRYKNLPTYHFTADGIAVELCVFNPRTAREAPLSPVDGRPMERVPLRDVEALLQG